MPPSLLLQCPFFPHNLITRSQLDPTIVSNPVFRFRCFTKKPQETSPRKQTLSTMLLQNILLGAIAATSCVLSAALEPRDQVTALKQQAFAALKKSNYSSGCNPSNAVVRQDWAAFTTVEKKDYINAVLCLQKKPALTPTSLIPGVRTRYDDFVGTHINQTNSIHNTVSPSSLPGYYMRTLTLQGQLSDLAPLLSSYI